MDTEYHVLTVRINMRSKRRKLAPHSDQRRTILNKEKKYGENYASTTTKNTEKRERERERDKLEV